MAEWDRGADANARPQLALAENSGLPVDNNETATVAAGVVQLAQANTVDVPMPDTLETVVVRTQPDTVYDLPDSVDGAEALQSNGNLMLAFPNGGLVEFSGFGASSGVRFHTPDKGMLDADSFLLNMQHHEAHAPAPIDNPDFAPGPPPEILGALAPIGALPPTELSFKEPEIIHHDGALAASAGSDTLPAVELDNDLPTAPSGFASFRALGFDPASDPDLAAVRHFAWSQMTDNDGQQILLPEDPDGDPVTIKVVSLPPEFGGTGSAAFRVDLYVDNNGTKEALHPGDVLTPDQMENSLFYWATEPHSSPTFSLGDMVYSVTDTHMHTVQGTISFYIPGE